MKSGKDTFSQILIDVLKEQDVTVVRRGFADKLKLSAYRLISPDATIEEALEWADEFKHFGFTDFNWDAGSGVSMHGRQFLQRYGTESHRDVFGDRFWIDALLPLGGNFSPDEPPDWEHSFYPADIAVVSDVRFDNEAQRIRDLDGIVARIDRKQLDGGSDTHVSEQPVEADVVIDNNGSLDDLRDRAVELFRDNLVV